MGWNCLNKHDSDLKFSLVLMACMEGGCVLVTGWIMNMDLWRLKTMPLSRSHSTVSLVLFCVFSNRLVTSTVTTSNTPKMTI